MMDNKGKKHTLRTRYTYCFSTGAMVARTLLNVTFITTLPPLFNIKVLVAPKYFNLIWTMFCFSFNKLGSNIIVFLYFVHHFYHKNLWFFQFNSLTSFFYFVLKPYFSRNEWFMINWKPRVFNQLNGAEYTQIRLETGGENLRAWVEWEYVKKRQ